MVMSPLAAAKTAFWDAAAEPVPDAVLEAGHELAHGRQLGQLVGAHRRGHRERTQLAGPEVAERRQIEANSTWVWPPIRSLSAGAMPLRSIYLNSSGRGSGMKP